MTERLSLNRSSLPLVLSSETRFLLAKMMLLTIVIVLSPIILRCCTNPNGREPMNNDAFSINWESRHTLRDDRQNNYRQNHQYDSRTAYLYTDPHLHHYMQHGFTFPEDNFQKLPGKTFEEERLPMYKRKDIFSPIPLELIRKFNNFSEINDLLINLVEGHTQDEAPVLEDRFSVGERSAAIIPKSAACMPELQTVKIAANDDPSILYVPSCTRLERCGGCCSHSLLSCQPTDVETVSFQVVKTQFVGGSKLKFMGKEVVLVERHTKCKCDCKVQEKDCNKFQEYRKSECRCACTNIDEEKKCYKENITKLWNPEICACECRNILQCSTGYTFDTIRCRCMPVYIRRRYAEISEQDQEKTHYQTEVMPVVPLVEGENLKDSL